MGENPLIRRKEKSYTIPLPNQSGDGCGAFMQEDTLYPLEKMEGIELFCNSLKHSYFS